MSRNVLSGWRSNGGQGIEIYEEQGGVCTAWVEFPRALFHRRSNGIGLERRKAVPLTRAERQLVLRVMVEAPGLLALCEEALHYLETPGDFSDHDRANLQADLGLTIAGIKGEDVE